MRVSLDTAAVLPLSSGLNVLTSAEVTDLRRNSLVAEQHEQYKKKLQVWVSP